MNSLDESFEKAQSLGLHNRDNHALRIKWVNALRAIVSRRMPKNKMGATIISDVDLLTASPAERLEALLKAVGKWKELQL